MYFKDNNNQVFWYDDNQMDLVGDKVQMTDEEIELHLNPPKTAEEIQAEINQEALAYLASTDWYVVRFAETGVAIPEDVVQARAEARSKIKEVA